MQNKLADSEEDNKNKTHWDVIGSMADAKIALSHAVRLAADYRAEVLKREATLSEIEQKALTEQQQLKAELQKAEAQLTNSKQQHHAEIIKLEKERQDTFGTLIEENKENKQVVSTLQNRLDTIVDVTMSPHIRKKRASVNYELEDLNLSSDGTLRHDDEVALPEWRRTPLGKRLARMRSTSGTSSSICEPLLRCFCASSCSSNRCMCYKVNKECDERCRCKAEKCHFKLKCASFLENSDLNQTYKVADDDSSLTKRRKVSNN